MKGIFDKSSPYTKEECEEIIQKIEALLDNTLSPHQANEIINKIKECSFCLEQYEIERNIRKLLKMVKKQQTQNHINELKENILKQIKEKKC